MQNQVERATNSIVGGEEKVKSVLSAFSCNSLFTPLKSFKQGATELSTLSELFTRAAKENYLTSSHLPTNEGSCRK